MHTTTNLRRSIQAIAITAALPAAQAYEFTTSDPELKISWNNTFKYSGAYRLRDASARLLAGGYNAAGPADFTGYNLDDGNQNFRNKGIVSSRVDWLSEFDAGTRTLGMRISAAGWYDAAYTLSLIHI